MALLEVLQDTGVEVDGVVGTSAGALVGCAYAEGALDRVKDVFEHVLDILLTWDRGSLRPLDKQVVSGKLDEVLGEARLEECNPSVTVSYVDVERGEEVACREGLAQDILLRSMAVPFLMNDVNDKYIDGGFWSPLPLHLVDDDVDSVIASDVTMDDVTGLVEDDGMVSVSSNLYTLTQKRMADLEIDLFRERRSTSLTLFNPLNPDYASWDVNHVGEMYDESKRQAEDFVSQQGL